MRESSRRTLVLGSGHFPTPHGYAVAHAARRELEPTVRPIGCVRRIVEARPAVEDIEIDADELAVFHADAGFIDQIGHAAGGIDLIVGTAGRACFRLDDLDAVFECLLDDDDAREACVRRAVCDIELHIQCAIQIRSRSGGTLLATPDTPKVGKSSALPLALPRERLAGLALLCDCRKRGVSYGRAWAARAASWVSMGPWRAITGTTGT